MEMTAVDIGAAPQGAERRFMINVLTPRDGPPWVRSCELQGAALRQRTSFSDQLSIDAVFEARLAAALRSCLAQLDPDIGVLSLPDLRIELEGLTLGGVHLMVRKDRDGAGAMVIFRFRILSGSSLGAFLPELGLQGAGDALPERLALEVLCDVGLPVLDLCAWAEGDGFAPESLAPAFARRVAERAHELRFRLELIKRYLADGPGEAPTSARAADPARRLLQ